MKTYLTNLLAEKGITNSIDNAMIIDGHFGLSYEMQIDFICLTPQPMQKKIRETFVYIDFKNGDVEDYWNHLTKGMLESLGY